jgi:hypothetical protein
VRRSRFARVKDQRSPWYRSDVIASGLRLVAMVVIFGAMAKIALPGFVTPAYVQRWFFVMCVGVALATLSGPLAGLAGWLFQRRERRGGPGAERAPRRDNGTP